MFSRNRFRVAFLVLAFAALACNLPTQEPTPFPTLALPTFAPPTAAPTADATKITLEVQATALAASLTQQAVETQAQPTVTGTATQDLASAATPEQPPAADMESRIKNAKILVYEDAGSSYQLGLWVRDTLNVMGLKYTHVGDALGNFMSNLNSGTQWDLIIVAAESRRGVQGEFWDIITPKVSVDKTALIVEMWYLSNIANGRIKSLTSKCGIEFQSMRGYVDSIYTLDSSSPIFSTPNSGFSLTNYVGYWKDKGGDYVSLSGGDATLLAGGFVNEKSRYGMITSCFEGRAIIQTFSTHDYKRESMQMLWENYIVNTLTNHFNALP